MINKKTLTNFTIRQKNLIIGVLSFIAGIVNGFLGTGGGIVLMLAFSLLPTKDEASVRNKFAEVIAVILPLSLISAFVYGDNIDLTSASPYIIPGILGGVSGALLLDKLSVKLVKKLFALMIIWAGINFLR